MMDVLGVLNLRIEVISVITKPKCTPRYVEGILLHPQAWVHTDYTNAQIAHRLATFCRPALYPEFVLCDLTQACLMTLALLHKPPHSNVI
jgi:hypothetical protein